MGAMQGLKRREPHLSALEAVAARYATAITPAMEALINEADPADPIAKQFRPDEREAETRPDEAGDPIGDAAYSPVKGIVHRYPDRCLLKLIHVCPVYCRFCFRREHVGPDGDGMLSAAETEAALAYIENTPSLWEVIFSGGDPFLLSARRAREITQRLAAIDHVKVLRWHTRIPAVDPLRVTPDLIEAIKAAGKATYVVLHINHARELTLEARAAIARLVDAGVPMLSQSVLLKGVNDDVDSLEALMRSLVEARVKPYYLHHLDRAPGTAHFRCSIAHGQDLMRGLSERASGLARPSFMLDLPGGHGKVSLGSDSVRDLGDGAWRLKDRGGDWRDYDEGES